MNAQALSTVSRSRIRTVTLGTVAPLEANEFGLTVIVEGGYLYFACFNRETMRRSWIQRTPGNATDDIGGAQDFRHDGMLWRDDLHDEMRELFDRTVAALKG
ncbi:hypothetical protein UFOVP75_6 [uncultured Caudovirales phage]|uniref:Uncharacterized protein n=1 Tax=uncultured Caudovirales phage TaxID=2100421 RepID=A0A6J5KWZ4_9CAUD|nr:hypothetical protein UFOVP75_6 [uncultured Caudovirales phage]